MPWFSIAIPGSIRPRQMYRAPIVVLLENACPKQCKEAAPSPTYIIKQPRIAKAACDRAAHEGPVGDRSGCCTAYASAAPAVVRIRVDLSGRKWSRAGRVVNAGDEGTRRFNFP